MVQRLFVYGTLGPGRPHGNILTTSGSTWPEAAVRGHLQPQGWGAALGYPGLVLDQAGPEVRGCLFSSEKLADHWPELDAFEGAA
jgi:gamma-glutamylcyclotransferase (GGCT)/AIG2-like uncharacterized protein YtfP